MRLSAEEECREEKGKSGGAIGVGEDEGGAGREPREVRGDGEEVSEDEEEA